MNRLQQELLRLYGLQASPDAHQGAGDLDEAQAAGAVRAMVLELARPADWATLSAVWASVQADLALPAPAIAVNGSDGCQLWLSLQEPVAVARASAFLAALQRRYLADMAPARMALCPSMQASHAVPCRPVPALQADSGQWSAFITPDLVPMFTDEPWLVVPPNPDGQAKLLAPLACITPEAFDLAWQRLVPAPADAAPGPAAPAAVPPAVPSDGGSDGGSDSGSDGGLDPRRFLLGVMNNDRLDLALRIEAAKALLPGFDTSRGG